MSKELIIYLTIAVYAVFMIAIGVISSKSNKSLTNFTVGKRDASGWASALSYGATYFSAVMFIGYSGASGWKFGLWSVLIGLGNAVFGSLLSWLVLAKRTREVSKRLKIKSMPQLFEKRFEDSRMKTFSAIIIFIFLIPYSASVYKGLSSVCSVVLGVSDELCYLIIAISSALILVLGGYLATLKADFFQGIVMMIGVTALIISIVNSNPVGGLANGITKMRAQMTNMEINFQDLIAMILMTSFGAWGLPQMVHKFFGIKNDKEIKIGTAASTFFALLVAGGVYFIGSLSKLFFSELPSGGTDYLVPFMMNNAQLSNILVGVIIVLLISASVSTLSGITLTACSSVTMDLIKSKIKTNVSDKKLLLLTRIFCLLFVLCSYALAHSKSGIVELMSYSWGVISGSFLAPYVLSLYWKGMNKVGGWLGMITGFCTAMVPVVYTVMLGNPATKYISGPIFATLAMIVSFAFCFIGTHSARFFKLKDSKGNQIFYNHPAETVD